ncbi:MAG: cytochrome c maturation protein CcmE, partial [Thermoplasmata archaeon]|nr:cytochrome c maturation protein CcmE [Thermoplasmata archaeon]
PSEILKDKTKHLNKHVEVRGTVKEETLDSQNKTFVLTDDKADLLVNYTGFLPSNFEEGKDVVVKGTLREQIIVFIEADEIVVGCASKY